jgi:putative mycofactocin binding protein MftB
MPGIKLHRACRVRQEEFGLLFYDSRGPRLLFAETGDLLAADFFDVVRGREELPGQVPEARRKGLARLVQTLTAKGFLCEQPLC